MGTLWQWVKGRAPRVKGRPLNNLRNLALWIVIAVMLVLLFNLFQGTGTHTTASAISYSKFTEQVQANQVKKVVFQGEQAKGEFSTGQPFVTTVPEPITAPSPMVMKGSKVTFTPICAPRLIVGPRMQRPEKAQPGWMSFAIVTPGAMKTSSSIVVNWAM